MPVDARRKLAAFALCLLGMGALDHGLRLIAEMVAPDYVRGSGAEAFLAIERVKSRIVGLGEVIGVTVLCLLALRLSFPHGIRQDVFGWLLALVGAFAPGRSFLGVGEGFTTSFGLLLVGCLIVALLLHAVLHDRSA